MYVLIPITLPLYSGNHSLLLTPRCLVLISRLWVLEHHKSGSWGDLLVSLY